MNFVKTSVATKTFSRPSEAGSKMVKSTATTSRGRVAKNGFIGACILGCGCGKDTSLTLFDPLFYVVIHS